MNGKYFCVLYALDKASSKAQMLEEKFNTNYYAIELNFI